MIWFECVMPGNTMLPNVYLDALLLKPLVLPFCAFI